MDQALLRTANALVDAVEFEALGFPERQRLRDDLSCPACAADAYFIREARNGRRACFGARPHRPDCGLASVATDYGGGADLDETDQRINAGDVFTLHSNRPRAIRHVDHDPTESPGLGSAVRYVGRNRRAARVSSMNLDRLLFQLVMRTGFAGGSTRLEFPSGKSGLVRSMCKHVLDVGERDVGQERVYWGTVRFPRPARDGAAWLNTGSRNTASILIQEEELAALLHDKHLEDVDDLSGGYFAILTKMRRGVQSGKLTLFADDYEWLAFRPFDVDDDN